MATRIKTHSRGSSRTVSRLSRNIVAALLLLSSLVACSPTPLEQKPAADEGLWFAKAAVPSERKYFAHYFSPFPRSLNNSEPDYYAEQYLRASGENGVHAAYGGFWRDRPLERPPLADDFQLTDAEWEIQAAQKMGIDGFVVDLLSLSGTSYVISTKLVDAAIRLGTGFKIIPMIDSNGEAAQTATSAQWADALGYFIGKPSSYYLADGRYLITSFYAEKWPVSWWTERLASVATRYGIVTAFHAGLLDLSHIASYTPIASFVGPWSYGADPVQISHTTPMAFSTARANGLGWMGSVLTQNVRPSQRTFDEAANSEALRASWARIIREDADLVQGVTWNDFAEGSQLAPSVARSWGPAAIAAYYAERWKTGAPPPILQDVLILSHRDQLLPGAEYQSRQSELMVQKSLSSATPVRNLVEALTYLTEPAMITVTVGGVTSTYAAPAGEYSKTFPLALGTVAGSVSRAGKVVTDVTSPFVVTAPPVSQDAQYFFVSSLHGTEGQHPVMGL